LARDYCDSAEEDMMMEMQDEEEHTSTRYL
jgi:hypothetical protein